MGTLRIVIVDDDAQMRGAMMEFLSQEPGHDVVASVGDGRAGVLAFERERPDVVLMDLQMPVLSGIEAIAEIRANDPRACVVAMTTFDTRDRVVAALRAGAAGYLLKDSTAEQICDGIEQAFRGEMPLSAAVRRELVLSVAQEHPAQRPGISLTPRQCELVGWLAEGLTNQQISQRMYLSEGSVKQYLNQISQRLGASNRTQVLVKALQLGLVDAGGRR